MTNKTTVALDDVLRIQTPTAVTLSPDGALIAYTVSRIDTSLDRDVVDLWIVPLNEGSQPRCLVRGTNVQNPAFTPDGSALIYRDSREGAFQAYSVGLEGGTPRLLTSPERFPSGVGEVSINPEGDLLAFVATPTALESEQDSTARPLVLSSLTGSEDGSGYIDVNSGGPQVFLVHLVSGEAWQLSAAKGSASEPAWSPDGSRVGFCLTTSSPFDSVAQSRVHVLSVTDRNCETPPTAGFSAEVRGPLLWNPNGNSIIAVSEPAIAHRHTSLVQLHLNGAEPDVVLTGRLDRNVLLPAPGYPGTVPVLTHDGQHVLFSIRESGWTEIHALSLADGDVKPYLDEANRVYSGLAVAAEAPILALIVATGTAFPEIAVMDQMQGTLHNVTTLTDSVLGDRCLTKPIERRFRTGDGTEIHGWLLRGEDQSGPGPLLLDIHGGPHNAWTGAAGPAWIYHHELLSRGWSVLTINSRGSDGYGEKFYTALQGKWGFADEPDFLEAIDALVEEGIADPTKLAVAGYSYGGFMTCHLTSRTKRFFAAVAGGSLCDLPALVGAADEGWNVLRYELQADPYNDRKELSAMSPAARAKDVVTPTLLLHGASDSRTPLSQAEEWAALLLGNGTKCELVAYPGEFHALPTKGRPSFRYDYQLRLVTWLEQHLDASERGTRPDAS